MLTHNFRSTELQPISSFLRSFSAWSTIAPSGNFHKSRLSLLFFFSTSLYIDISTWISKYNAQIFRLIVSLATISGFEFSRPDSSNHWVLSTVPRIYCIANVFHSRMQWCYFSWTKTPISWYYKLIRIVVVEENKF